MNHIWTFTPDEPFGNVYKSYRPTKKDRIPAWRAPEHLKMTKDMTRDFPRDDFGLPIDGSKRDQLVLDKRPAIMVPERPKKFLTLEERSSVSPPC